MVGAVALLTCLICPLLETFDHWDPPIQTGNDTEYALVILALCVGGLYSAARFLLKSPPLSLIARRAAAFSMRAFSQHPSSLAFLLSDTPSPPLLPLRI
jgi:hypothetical protein